MTDDMTNPEPRKAEAAARKERRFWLTVGEVVAVLGLGLGGLNYWEGHRDREASLAQAAQQAKAQAVRPAPAAFILRGDADSDGSTVMLAAVKPDQVIQSQRYVFPTPVLDHVREIGAGKPQIDLDWFEDGLKRALKAQRKAGAATPKGEAMMPVGVVTTYVEDGDQRTDRSLYRVGYVAAKAGLLGGEKLRLTGLSLVRRGAGENVQAEVDAAWRAQAPALPAKPPKP